MNYPEISELNAMYHKNTIIIVIKFFQGDIGTPESNKERCTEK